MTVLRAIGHDLVEKKLWPLAVLLVLALVAVPVALGGGGSPQSTPADPGATAAVAPGGAPVTAEVAVAVEQPALRRRAGATRDPFRQQYVRKATGTVDGAVTGATGVATVGPVKDVSGGTPSSPVAATTGPSGSSGPSSTPGTTTVPKLDPLDVYRVALRFGTDERRRTLRNVSRLSPLPNAEQPFFVFLGVLAGGKKAVFLVGADAQVTGDGTCRPSRTNCETVEMGTGDTVFLDRETADGITQYELELLSVTRRTNAQAVAATQGASTSQKRQSAAKDEAAEDLTDLYRWDDERGVLVRRKLTRAARSAPAATRTPAPQDAPAVAGHTAAEYRAWYLAVYLEYLRQLAAGTAQAAQQTAAVLDAVPQP